MKRRIWSVEEIEGLLLAAHQANSMARAVTLEGETEAMEHYQQGFVAALLTLALAFGIRPPAGMSEGSMDQGYAVETLPPAMRRLGSR